MRVIDSHKNQANNNIIDSRQNKTVKSMFALLHKKNREAQNLFLAEGLRFVSEIPPDWAIISYVLSEHFMRKNEGFILREDVPVTVLSERLFKELSQTVSPQGILAVVRKKEHLLENILCDDGRCHYLLLEGITDPGNLGTIIRTAEAVDIKAVFITKSSADIYNDKALRATMGSVFRVPIFTDVLSQEILEFFHQSDITTIGASLDGDDDFFRYPIPQKCAFVIGSEAIGLLKETQNCINKLIKIPMPGKAESLNAGIATGILIYEGLRAHV